MKSKTLEIIKNNIQIVADQIERLTGEDKLELLNEILIEAVDRMELIELEPDPDPKPEGYYAYMRV